MDLPCTRTSVFRLSMEIHPSLGAGTVLPGALESWPGGAQQSAWPVFKQMLLAWGGSKRRAHLGIWGFVEDEFYWPKRGAFFDPISRSVCSTQAQALRLCTRGPLAEKRSEMTCLIQRLFWKKMKKDKASKTSGNFCDSFGKLQTTLRRALVASPAQTGHHVGRPGYWAAEEVAGEFGKDVKHQWSGRMQRGDDVGRLRKGLESGETIQVESDWFPSWECSNGQMTPQICSF